jgi:hypothetical protein
VATAQGHFQQVKPLKSRLTLGIPTEAIVPSMLRLIDLI